MAIQGAFNFKKWIDEHRHLLKPPVGNITVYQDTEFIVMVVGGPNSRKDYHYNETEEWFYQLEGNITINIQEDGQAVPIHLGPGDMFLCPAKTPHSPGRAEDSIGLVIERSRKGTNFKDGLMWFCEKCNNKLHETYFEQNNIETDFQPKFKEYYGSEDLRTCKKCGHVMETDPRFL
jgi:3-hydroxyanthranilate 3,4-dioxygenase